ncbi:MAG TPA: C4-type zinc ribbon domain-containing protein [Actinomycetota bacterium]|nr:C4-type zinc ribbon domain-containing protein [Actinomycetota bacterium]
MSLEERGPDETPPDGVDLLLELQEVDLSVDRLHLRLRELEEESEVRAARERLAAAESRLGELRLQLDEVTREQRKLEQDVEFLQRKIDAERQRLFDGSVANPKELQSIEAEVESLRARKGRVEDQVLERMERREELEAQLGPVEAEVAEARRRVEELEEASARELVEVERTLEERTAERERLAARVDPELLELYEDLRRQKKGVGAVALVSGVCQGCHQKLSPVYLERLKRTAGVKRCEYCRRILVPR